MTKIYKEPHHHLPEDYTGYWEYCTDASRQIAYTSSSLRCIIGLSPEEIVQNPLNISFIIHPDDLPAFKKHIQYAYEKNRPGEIELRIILSDQSVHWIRHSCFPSFDEQGRYTGTRGINVDITERKQVERIIKAQRDLGLALDRASCLKESLELCLETAMDVSQMDAGSILMLDPKTGRLNLVAARGLSDDTVKRHLQFTADSPMAKIVQAGQAHYLNRRELISLRKTQSIEKKRRSTGVIPFLDKGKVIGALIVTSDVFDELPRHCRNALETIAGQMGAAIGRAQAEQKLRGSEEKYRTVFENAVEGIFQTTPDGKILNANLTMARIFGYDSVEAFLNSVDDVGKLYADPEDRKAFRLAIEKAGAVQKFDVAVRRKDGEKILIAISARAVRDTAGRILYYDGFYEDITQRKKMENDLRHSEERLRRIVETSNAGILLTGKDGRILFANRQMGAMLGYTADELIGSNYHEHVHPDEQETVVFNMKTLIESNTDQLIAQRRFISRDTSERWGYVSFGRLETGPGDYQIVLVVSDVTSLKKAEREKELLEEHLRQAQKMEALGVLAGGIAHDFNNILASMLGFTEMAARETRKVMRDDYLGQVLLACERAKNLVDQILAFSRQTEHEKKPIDMRLIVKEVLILLRATLPATIEIRQTIQTETALVLADPSQIHQVIMNLCTNAAQAMTKQKGAMDIQLSVLSARETDLATGSQLRTGSYVCLSVQDDGCGIDPSVREKIFHPFFTTKKKGEGTGLGLSVVYGIVKGCDGMIDVESTPGEGSSFTVYLPRVEQEQAAGAEPERMPNLCGRARILFVDDEETLVRMARVFFESLGYTVKTATSGIEALRLFRKKTQEFDLVITDMTMPRMTGADLATALLKIRPDLPIILCTGYSEAIDRETAKKLKIREFLMKPISLDALGLTVKRVLET